MMHTDCFIHPLQLGKQVLVDLDDSLLRRPPSDLDEWSLEKFRALDEISTSSQESTENLSKLLISNVSKLLKCKPSLRYTLGDKETDHTKMITKKNFDLTILYRAVYDDLKYYNDRSDFPDEESSEVLKKDFVSIFLSSVLKFVKTNFGDQLTNFDEDESEMQVEKARLMNASLLGNNRKFKPDLIVRMDSKEESLGEFYYLMGIEVKAGAPASGYKKAAFCLQQMATDNNDQRKIYGLCSNALSYNFLSYDPKKGSNGHALSCEYELMFGRMFRVGYEVWCTEKYTLIIDLVFAAMCEMLEIEC